MRREVLEETGLVVKDVRFLFSYPNKYLYSVSRCPPPICSSSAVSTEKRRGCMPATMPPMSSGSISIASIPTTSPSTARVVP